MENNNILVIGGAGYIGSHQVKDLLNNNFNVYVLDNLSTGHRKMIDSRASFIEGDIRDYDLLCKVMKENMINAVMHFAAFSIVPQSVEQPLKYFNNNVYGFEVLLEAMEECSVDKLIFSSTAATYGEHKQMPIDENYSTNPTNPYGESKLIMEKMVKWQANASNLKYVVLRYFNVAGAAFDSSVGELHDPETHLIPIVLECALHKREFVSIFGNDYDTEDGTCIRDYIHVVDLCDAHTKSLDYLMQGNKSDTFNLGYGHGFSVKQIIESTQRVTKKDIPIRYDERRAGDPAILIASSLKAQKALNWSPKYNNIDIIIETAYKFYRKNIEK
ncbi:MAG: UDP-glucose 4-epimerase GalE [Erysipelotrichales bacterium]